MSVVRRDLRAMTADGAAAAMMVGIGETYFPAFVLAISSSQLACGLVSTVPMLLGAVLQLCVPWGVRKLGSYRRWVVLVAAAQAIGFLPLLVAALVGAMPLTAAFLIVAIYWATGMASGTAWNAWAGTLVPERIRAPYFAGRTRFSQSGIMLGLALGGIILEMSTGWGVLPEAFALLFLVAAVSRIASAYFLSRQRETASGTIRLPEPGGLLEAMRCNINSRVLLYMLVAQAACYIASPYFNPYMLGQLQLSYVQYLILICVPYLAKVVCVPAWGRIVDRIGPRPVLWGSGILIALLPAMWNLSDSFSYLLAVQAYSGVGWAGYELAQLLLFFNTVPTQRRVGVLTVYNLFNAAAIFVGSILGGLLLSQLGAGRNAYWMLFLVSTVARCAAVLVVVRLPAWAARPQSAATNAAAALAALPRSERQLGATLRTDGAHPKPVRAKHPGNGRRLTTAEQTLHRV